MIGTVIAWSQVDGVGRIRLESGEELRVGQTAIGNTAPELGTRCEVLAVEPHPLGGQRATKVKLLGGPSVAPSGAPPPPLPDRSAWLLERIRSSSQQPVAAVEVQNLVTAYEVLAGKRHHPQVFGIDPRSVDVAGERRLELLAAIEAELTRWRGQLVDPLDRLELERAGHRLGLKSLRGFTPPELRCEPLGTLDGLAPAWVKRAKAWAAARKGKHRLRLDVLGLDEHDGKPRLGRPDTAALREQALRYELSRDEMFPRELAALVAMADGLTVGDTEVIRGISEWSAAEDGLEIGSGSTSQGSLTLLESRRPLVEWEVLDRDDDQTVLHRLNSLGELFDVLLGITS